MIVLDTQAWLWWTSSPAHLSETARTIIEENETSGLLVSVISAWEISLKHSLGKLKLSLPIQAWLHHATRYPGVSMQPLDLTQAVASTMLPTPVHRDPADCFIIALSRSLNLPLITSDARIREYPHVDTLW